VNGDDRAADDGEMFFDAMGRRGKSQRGNTAAGTQFAEKDEWFVEG